MVKELENTIWIEKYRPQDFSEMKGQTEIVSRVKKFVETKNMPHLLFAGPAGIGKTTLALIIAKKMFGEQWRHNFLELNASDERGIDIIRNKVKDFARTRAIGDAPFKIIYLDESDALTSEAQQALRRTMENYTKTCRFILSCNYSSKIIDPIQSRCVMFRFKPLAKEEIFEIITKISKQEGVEVTENGREALYEVSGGDCRKLENIMQSTAAINQKIDEETVYSLASKAKPEDIIQVIKLSLSNNFSAARKKLLKTMLEKGLSGIDVIKQIQKEVWNIEIDAKKKMKMIEKCGEIEFRLSEGSDEFIQLEALLGYFGLLGSE